MLPPRERHPVSEDSQDWYDDLDWLYGHGETLQGGPNSMTQSADSRYAGT